MQLPMCHLLVKNHLWNQHGEDWTTSQCGGFVFQKMPGELFISECSSINIVPHCWAPLHHNDIGMPPLSRKSSQSNSSLGEGTAGRRRGGQTKGNLITPGHGSSTSQKREIHHLWDQTETCAQGTAQWKLHPPMQALSFLSPLFSSHRDDPRPHRDSRRQCCVSFERTLWNPA